MAAWAANAEPPPMTAEEQHLAALLRETTAADANRIGAAEAQLASASDQPGFAAALLGCVSRAAPTLLKAIYLGGTPYSLLVVLSYAHCQVGSRP